jgi:hypothetical protein
MRLLLCAALLAISLVLVPTIHAVDQVGIKVGERWSVVGVIGGDASGRSVAVLLDNLTKKTYTLAVGDPLPVGAAGFVLKAVNGRSVVVASAKEAIILAYTEETYEEPSDAPSRTSRFLDTYYRGLGESQFDVERGEYRDANGDTTVLLPLSRLGVGGSEGRSRDDFGGIGRAYRFETQGGDGPAGDGGVGFVGSYDNGETEADDIDGDAIDQLEPHLPLGLQPLRAPAGLSPIGKRRGVYGTVPTYYGQPLNRSYDAYDAATETLIDDSAPLE